MLNGVGGTGPEAQQLFQVEAGHRAIFVYPTSLPNDEAGGAIAWARPLVDSGDPQSAWRALPRLVGDS